MNIRTPFLKKRGGVLFFWVCKLKDLGNAKVRIVNLGVVRRPDDYHWGFNELLEDAPLFWSVSLMTSCSNLRVKKL